MATQVRYNTVKPLKPPAMKTRSHYLHCASEKFKPSVTLSNLKPIFKICTAGKRMKFAKKPYWTLRLGYTTCVIRCPHA